MVTNYICSVIFGEATQTNLQCQLQSPDNCYMRAVLTVVKNCCGVCQITLVSCDSANNLTELCCEIDNPYGLHFSGMKSDLLLILKTI